MINIAVENEEVIKALSDIADIMPEKLKEALLNAGLAIEARAKEKVGGGTGSLRRSITTKLDEDELGVTVGSNLEYAPYVHEGTGIKSRSGTGRQNVPWVYYDERNDTFVTTSGIDPNPFLEDAVNELSADLLNYFKGILEND